MKALKEMYDNFFSKVFGYLNSEEGQGLVEYALILLLIALVVIAFVRGTGQQVNAVWSQINSGLSP